MINKPQISVIMPVYNAEKYINSAVQSILDQSFLNFEFIIINDGSTDDSLNILQRFALKDKRIRLISRENKGLVETLNEGIEIAQAPLIARMDADDISLPERLRIQKEYMDLEPNVVCIGTGARVIDHKNRFLIIMETKVGFAEVELAALQGLTPITHPTAMMRTEKVKSVGGYKASMYPAEDLALWLELCEIGKINNLSDVLLEYRIHDDSISTKVHDKQLLKISEICEQACKKRGVNHKLLATKGRPGKDRNAKFEITLRHGWWAFSNKQWQTSAIYAFKAIRLLPFKDGGWRLLFCSYLRRVK